MKELYSRMKGSLNLKRQYVQFSILSLLYFVLYTLFSVVLGAIVHDAATIIGFWILNLISTYVYMRFFFRMAAGMAKAEKTIYFRECIGMLMLETILYFFTIALYYLFVAFVDLYVMIGIIAYLYAFFAPAFQLFCFYQVFQGTKSPWRIVGGALKSMAKVWKAVIGACAALAVVYCMLYIFSMGLEVMISSLLPHVLILNIGVTMNRWMEVGTLLLSMVTNQFYDSAVMMFLLMQVIAAVLFSCLYVLWMGWIAALCESAWNSRH